MIPGSAITAQAKENDNLPIAGIESVLAECYQSDWQHPIELYLVPTEQEEYSNMVFANVEDFLYVRKEPDEDSEWLGKLYKDGAATADGTEGDYTLIRSGSVEGYVLTDQLYTGGTAKEYALQAAQKQATVTAYVLNVRSGQGTEYEILTQITKDQTYQVTGEAVDGWYPIRAGETDGWVSGEYVTVTDSFTYAESREEEQASIAAEEAQKAAEEAAAQAEAQRALEAAQVRSSGQAVIDYDAKTLVTGEFDHTIDLTVTNNVKMFNVAAAALHTIGGPISNNYQEILQLTMGSDSFDQLYVGTAAEAAAAESQQAQIAEAGAAESQAASAVADIKAVTFAREKLNDFDYLIQNFYLVDNTTTHSSMRLPCSERMYV